MLEGIDVSQYQLTTPSLTGRDFLIARASIGTRTDTRYAGHVLNARAAGLVIGAYHFGHDQIDISAQVDVFLDMAGDVDLYALDVEGSHAPSVAQTREFIRRCADRGVAVGLYASESSYFEAGQAWRWVANWSRSPRIPWDIWQYRGSPLDLDRFDGSIDELRALGQQPEDSMLIPQRLGHTTVARDSANIYSDPDGATALPTTIPKGRVLRVFGRVTGWAFVQIDGYGSPPAPVYAWMKSYDLAPNDEPLTVIDGAPPMPDPGTPVTYPVTVGGKPAGEVTLP